MRLQASKGMKIKEFAQLRGLNENSARRAIAKAIKEIEAGKSDHNKSDHNSTPDKNNKNKSDQVITKKRGRPRKADKEPEAAPSGDSDGEGPGADGDAHAPQDAPDCDQKGGDTPSQSRKKRVQKGDQKSDHKKPDLKVITGEVIHLEKKKPGAKPGNQNALTTGKKKRIKPEDVKAACALLRSLDLPEGWENSIHAISLNHLAAHLNLILRARDKSVERLVKEELEQNLQQELNLPPEPGDTVAQLTPPEFKLLKMLTDTGYSMTDISRTMSQLAQAIKKDARDAEIHAQKVEAHKAKMEQQREAHQLRLYGKMKGKLIAEANAILAEGQEGAALRAAQLLETNGVELPDTLRKLLDLEMQRERDKIDETGGMTPEELDAYVAAAEAKRAGHHEWLAKQRQEIAAVVDEHGYGDFDDDGVRRSDEIQAKFMPGEEIDLDATGDLYGDGDGPGLAPAEPGTEEVPENESADLWEGEGEFPEEDEPDETINDFTGEE